MKYTERIAFRTTPEVKEKVQERADALGLTLSKYLSIMLENLLFKS